MLWHSGETVVLNELLYLFWANTRGWWKYQAWNNNTDRQMLITLMWWAHVVYMYLNVRLYFLKSTQLLLLMKTFLVFKNNLEKLSGQCRCGWWNSGELNIVLSFSRGHVSVCGWHCHVLSYGVFVIQRPRDPTVELINSNSFFVIFLTCKMIPDQQKDLQ